MKKLALGLLIFIMMQCTNKSAEITDMKSYKEDLDTWHKERIESLKSENGWLNLVGLFWLKEGVNTFGSDSTNNLVFPSGKINSFAGEFILTNGTVNLKASNQLAITSDNEPFTNGVIYSDETSARKLTSGSLQWFIIKRDDQYGVRLRDLETDAVKHFTTIERFEVDADYRVEATLEVQSPPQKVSITNVLGQTVEQDSPGILKFNLKGEEYSLIALEEGDELFIIFADPTNRNDTYGAGRYLYAHKPDLSGKTILDFNKAYNPPCAFTAFATCPLPPVQNKLSIAIRAGEKRYKDFQHE